MNNITAVRIKQLRKSRNINHDTLATVLGLQSIDVEKIENGDRNITPFELGLLSNYFRCSGQYLLGITEQFQSNARMIPLYLLNPYIKVFEHHNIVKWYPVKIDSDISFGLVMGDDSMEPDIPKDAILFIRSQNAAKNKDIVVAQVPNEHTILRHYKTVIDYHSSKTNNIIILSPNNNTYKSHVYKRGDIRVLGVLVRVLFSIKQPWKEY